MFSFETTYQHLLLPLYVGGRVWYCFLCEKALCVLFTLATIFLGERERERDGSHSYQNFFMLNSAEHEILTANKTKL